MICPSCQQNNPDAASFCTNCGVGLSSSCSSCGAELPEEAQFCGACGSPVVRFSPARRNVEYAGFWRRLVSNVIDDMTLSVALAILLFLTSLVSLMVILLLVVLVYALYKHMKCKTLGRRLMGIKVVTRTGQDVGFWRGAFRETMGKFVSSLVLYLGFLWVAFDSEKRSWHDKMAGTSVVKTRPRPAEAL